jgi:hypothetical protein
MIPQPRPLIEVFSDIPDVRKSRGKRHPYLRSARPAELRHAACRRLAAQPTQALALIGIAFENCMALLSKHLLTPPMTCQ